VNKISKKVAVIGTVLVVVAITVFTSMGTQTRINKAYLWVEYDQPWQGTVSDSVSMKSWGEQESDQPYRVLLFKRPEDTDVWVISANAQKMDGSNEKLTIEIWYLDNVDNDRKRVILAEANTSQPYGVVQVSCEIKIP